ncbi:MULTISPECIES: cytochrome c oxidase subunit II [unclassified Oleiphilus]|jgi:cytochrome c oxidase subunit 2|nr:MULTISPECIES: cytochrome c oxidase subunit II [unclassified Oleiphilus]
MPNRLRKLSMLIAMPSLLLASRNVFSEYALNLPEPVSPVTREVFDLHMMTAYIALIIMILVTVVIFYSIFKFRKSKNYEADQEFHNSKFGTWSWILVPIIVLAIDLSIAGSASSTFDLIEDKTPADLTIKVTGSQWKWTYEYMEDDIKIVSNLLPEEQAGDRYLRMVDNPLYLPTDRRIRFLHTATDVLHAWWVPAIAVKKDSIPGYINETWTIIEKAGTYHGQCAENCGTGHAFMPIQVEAIAGSEFDSWMTKQKEIKIAKEKEASSDTVWPMQELMARGESLYNTNCGACHQVDGSGVPPAFPALAGSEIAKGDPAKHLEVVIKGVSGTAMAAWGAQLNDLEVAAIVTYERNAWGNNTGDVVQPADVKAAR